MSSVEGLARSRLAFRRARFNVLRMRPSSCRAPLLASFLCIAFLAVPPRSPDVQAQAPPPPPVGVETVAEGDFAPTSTAIGATEPRRTSVVAASIEGYVIEYPAREGATVKRGDILAHLRDDILAQEIRGAESALLEVKEWHSKARKDLERRRQLIGKDAVTQKELDAAETEERALAHRIPRAEAELEVLKLNFEKKKVKAPFDGQVVRELTEVGQWVAAGGQVVRLVDLSSVFVRFNVPERQIRFVKEGQSVLVTVDAARPEPYEGKVVSIAGEGDASARTFPVRVEIPNDGALRAGMTSSSRFAQGTPRKALLVSKDALILEGGRSFVFVVTDGAAQKKPVETGAEQDGKVEVLRGLAAGEKVVVRGNERLQPGAPVRLVGPPPAEANRH